MLKINKNSVWGFYLLFIINNDVARNLSIIYVQLRQDSVIKGYRNFGCCLKLYLLIVTVKYIPEYIFWKFLKPYFVTMVLNDTVILIVHDSMFCQKEII